MIVMVCIDDKGGMLFNGRRQSRDRILRQQMLREAAGGPLRMNSFSGAQFSPKEKALLRVSADFLEKAAPGDFCLVEDLPLLPYRDRIEKLILYKWNRVYPADRFLDLQPEKLGWSLVQRQEFPGSSHEKITKEVYIP